MRFDSRTSGPPQSGCPGLHALLQLADTVNGIDAVERMLLAYAVHPDGLDFERAHLLLHDALDDELVAWSGAAALGGEIAIVEAVTRAALTPTPPALQATARCVKWHVDALEGLAHLAWCGEPVALHAEGESAAAEGAVLLRGADRRHGLIVGGWRDGGPEDERHARLQRFHRAARHVLRAFERRRAERRGRLQVEVLGELARAAVSSLNVAEVLHLATECILRATDASGAALWMGEDAASLRLEVAQGAAATRDRTARALEPMAKACGSERRPRWVDRPSEDELLTPELGEALASVAMLPLAAYGHTFGTLAVYARRDGRPAEAIGFDSDARGFLVALGDHLALALDQADRCARLQRAAEREHELRHRMQRSELLAEYAREVGAHAKGLRQPVSSIVAFARRVNASAPGEVPATELLEIILREAERLERMVGGLETPELPKPPKVERVQANELVQQALQQVGETLVRRRIRLVKKLSPDVPQLLLDADRVREALRNLVRQAVDAIAVGGRFRVESRKVGGHVVIELAHDAPHEPGAALERLFVPFANDPSAAQPSLGLAHRIVREHGGEIRTRSEAEWSSIVALTLPIHDNQDRRRAPIERRQPRERRLRFPEASSG